MQARQTASSLLTYLSAHPGGLLPTLLAATGSVSLNLAAPTSLGQVQPTLQKLKKKVQI